MKLREAVAQRLGINSADAVFANGQVRAGNRAVSLGEAASGGEVSAEDTIEFGDISKKQQQSTFGAHFVEVGVDAYTGETGSAGCWRCARPGASSTRSRPAARSSADGHGHRAALMEELAVDTRRGFFANHDLAGYEVPVHADIPHQEVIFLDEVDPMSSPMKAKGVGELGICGVGAAVANAVYNATGIRVRDYPITLDKLLDRMPDAA